MDYFTSDLHFDDKNLARKRGYDDADVMNEDILATIIPIVKPGDRLFILGDLSLGKYPNMNEILPRIKCDKFLIKGNHDHDKFLKKISDNFVWIEHYHELKYKDSDTGFKNLLVLQHYPLLTWNRAHYGTYHIHGHCHGSLIYKDTTRMDVSWDCHKRLLTIKDIKEYMLTKTYKVVDHHVNRNIIITE